MVFPTFFALIAARPSFIEPVFPENFLAAVDKNAATVAEKLKKNFVVHFTGPPGTGKTFGVDIIVKKLIGCADFLIHFDETRDNQTMTIYRLSNGKVVYTFPEGANIRVLLTNCAKSSGITINGKSDSPRLSFNKRIVPSLFKMKNHKVIVDAINAQMTKWFQSKIASLIAENKAHAEKMAEENSVRIKEIKQLLGSDISNEERNEHISKLRILTLVPELDFAKILKDMVTVYTTNVLMHLTLRQYLVIVMSREDNSLAKAMSGMHIGTAWSFLQSQFSQFLGNSLKVFKKDEEASYGIKVESVDPTLFVLLPGYMYTARGMTYYKEGEIPAELPKGAKNVRKCLIVKGENCFSCPLHVTTNKELTSLTVTKLVTLNGARALFGQGTDGIWYHITVETTPFTGAAVFHHQDALIQPILNAGKDFKSESLEKVSISLMMAQAT